MITKVESDISHLFIQRDDRVVVKIPMHDQMGVSYGQKFVVVRSYCNGPEAFIYNEGGYLTDALYSHDGHYITDVSKDKVTSIEFIDKKNHQITYQVNNGKFVKIKDEILNLQPIVLNYGFLPKKKQPKLLL